MPKRINMINETFGKWRVVEEAGKTNNGTITYLCRCSCGEMKILSGAELRTGRTSSCRRCSKIKHHDTGSHLYMVWSSMIQRCCNPRNAAYFNYGGRGISVCEEWRNNYILFKDWALANGYKKDISEPGFNKITLDRKDNNGNYDPNNCKFSTRTEQNNNKRNCLKFR